MKALVKLAVLMLAIGLLSACKSTQTVVTVSYEGQGTITESTKINCGSRCQATYSVPATSLTSGYKIQLKATPAAGYEVFGWENCGSDPICSVQIEPVCGKFNVGPNFVTCSEYKTVQKAEHAIFEPAGSVLASSWYGNESCLVNTSGELKCWNTGFTPQDLPPVSHPTAVSIAIKAGCVTDDSGVHCWGNAEPQMPSLTAPSAIAVDNSFACAIDHDQVKCWGYPGLSNDVVAAIPPLSHPKQLWIPPQARGNICARDDTGIHCWGSAIMGQSHPPTLDHPVDIAADGSTSCALTADGIRCWGKPYDVTVLNGIVNNASQISDPSYYGMCAVDNNGAHCIGKDNVVFSMDPVFQDAKSVAVNGKFMCALTGSGPQCARLDQASLKPYALPAPAGDLLLAVGEPDNCTLATADNKLNCKGSYSGDWIEGFKDFQVPVTHANALAIMPAGAMWCVGADSGLYCRRDTSNIGFQRINLVAPPSDLTGVTDLDIKDYVACAVHSKGVTCWGDNTWGQLDVPPLSHPTKVAVGRYHACALDDTGVVCWGEKAAPPAS